MTYTIDPWTLGVAIVALLVGMFLGLAMRAGAKRRAAVLGERVDGLTRERDSARAEVERLQAEVKQRDAQIRPLSDEVDKLRRDFARARAGGEPAALPAGASADPLDLGQLKGVGPKFAAKLAGAGITRVDQIAGWSSADVHVIDAQMGEFKGRIETDRLVEQAQLLTQGRYTEYETRFGKIAPPAAS
jgi:predicted flap endonuclease-1-like 5' DNA nuclease